MNNDQLISAVMAKSRIQRLRHKVAEGGLNWSENFIKTSLSKFIPGMVQEVAMAHGWDFALDETTATTVADQGKYTLGGDDDNSAAGIYNIRLEGALLERIVPAAIDEIQSGRTLSVTSYWTPAGRTGTLPRVELIVAPTTSGDTITYRYWRSNVALSDFPASLSHLLETALAKRMVPSFEGYYDKALAEAVSAYRGPQTGPNTGGLDREILRRNRERAAMHNTF